MADKQKVFTDGMIIKPPRDGAPAFVKASISVKTQDFVKFLEEHTKPDGWVNIDVQSSAKDEDKWFGVLNQWTKDARPAIAQKPIAEVTEDDLPF